MRVREKRCTCREGEKRNQKCSGKDKRREGEGGGVGWWDIKLYRLITDLCLHLVLILILTLEGGFCQPYL